MTLAQAQANTLAAEAALSSALSTSEPSPTIINNARGRLIRCIKEEYRLTTDADDRKIIKADLQIVLKAHKDSLNVTIRSSKEKATNKSLSTEFVSKLRKLGTTANQISYSQNFWEAAKNSTYFIGNNISTAVTIAKSGTIFALTVSKYLFRFAGPALAWIIKIPFAIMGKVTNPSEKYDAFYLKGYGTGLVKITDKITDGLKSGTRRI